MLMETERRQIADCGRRMSAQGLSRGTSGNLSVYDAESGYMAISPSGMEYFSTEAADVAVMTLDGRVVEGARRPSSEHALHARFYLSKPQARAVVHAHPPFCTTFACLGMPLAAVHYEIAASGAAEVPCAEYAPFGTPELAINALKACGAGRAALLASHGLVVCGASLAEAFSTAVAVEFVAELQWRAMCVGRPTVIGEAEMNSLLERFTSYGQPK